MYRKVLRWTHPPERLWSGQHAVDQYLRTAVSRFDGLPGQPQDEIAQGIELLASSAHVLNEKALAEFTVNEAHIQAVLDNNPVLVTALSSVLGYEKCAEIATRAWSEGRPVRQVVMEMTELSAEEIDRLLDPLQLTRLPR